MAKLAIFGFAIGVMGLTAYAQGGDTKSYAQLLASFRRHGWRGSGPAEVHNMALYNWEHTGGGDTVYCSVCGKKEGGWASHEPASYHKADCPYASVTHPRTRAYRAQSFDRHGWEGKTGKAVKDNMLDHGWLHTGDSDRVFCPWCKKIEGAWSNHDPVGYHRGGCPCKTAGACDAGR